MLIKTFECQHIQTHALKAVRSDNTINLIRLRFVYLKRSRDQKKKKKASEITDEILDYDILGAKVNKAF